MRKSGRFLRICYYEEGIFKKTSYLRAYVYQSVRKWDDFGQGSSKSAYLLNLACSVDKSHQRESNRSVCKKMGSEV